jgi:hypothetical protein
VLYLPPYSPDLNPIEQLFAKLKALLRKAKERTIDDLWDRIGKLLDEFSATECSNYLANSGYAQHDRKPLSRGLHGAEDGIDAVRGRPEPDLIFGAGRPTNRTKRTNWGN